MFLGRSTPQWTGLFVAIGSTINVLIVNLVPTLDPVVVTTVIGSLVALAGVLVTFLANTATTPIKDPQLVVGTSVRVTDAAGKSLGSASVPTPDS